MTKNPNSRKLAAECQIMRPTNKKKKLVWIAWEAHRRTASLCTYLGITPIVFQSQKPRIIKHPFFLVKTLFCLVKFRPSNLIVQNPSVFLTFFACLLRRIFGYKLFVDTHNIGIFPENKILSALGFFYNFFQKEADVTIVTNDSLAKNVRCNKGRPFVLPDKLPTDMHYEKMELFGTYNITYICTFSKDDPFVELVRSCRFLPDDILVYITGKFNEEIIRKISCIPENVIFTGFLSDQKYWGLLKASDLIIDLTYRDNCLVCGAYEAVSLEKPFILSNTEALKKYFYKGGIFTNLEERAIADSIIRAINYLDILKKDVSALKEEIEKEWTEKGRLLKQMLI